MELGAFWRPHLLQFIHHSFTVPREHALNHLSPFGMQLPYSLDVSDVKLTNHHHHGLTTTTVANPPHEADRVALQWSSCQENSLPASSFINLSFLPPALRLSGAANDVGSSVRNELKDSVGVVCAPTLSACVRACVRASVRVCVCVRARACVCVYD